MQNTLLSILNNNGVIAYPTETVFGIGCKPKSNVALKRINTIKQRDANKGFIVVSHKLQHLQCYTDVDISTLAQPKRATTYIVPCKKTFIGLLTGHKKTIAIRLSSHPQIIEVCNTLNSAVVSTSLNISGKPAIDDSADAQSHFSNLVDYIVLGECGKQSPSQIIEATTNKVLRD